MKFNEAMAQGIADPSMNAYSTEIKTLQKKMVTEKDPKAKQEIMKNVARLKQELEMKRQEQQKKLANLQKDIQQTQAVT